MATVELVARREGTFVRPYAMKRLHRRGPPDAGLERMFLDEARIAGLLRHPNVVSVLDVGEDDRGPYLIMDYVEGGSLSQLIRAHLKRTGEPIPIQLGLRILVQAARGLAAAHELESAAGEHLELVHRDISPQNILVDLAGTVRVADFGIARATGRATQTERGVLKGKLGYLAPETLRFEPADHRADLFSLGVVAFEMCTGRRLYGGDDVNSAARAILHDPPPDLGMYAPDAPDGLVELMFRLLAKQPDLRPASAREVADRLDELLLERVSVEGPQPLDAFVRAHIERGDIEARRARLAELERSPAPRVDGAPPGAEAGGARGRWLGLAALAAVLLAGAAAWAFVAQPAETSPLSPAAVTDIQPPSTEAPPAEAPPAEPAPEVAEPASREPEPSADAPRVESSIPTEPAADRRRRARRAPEGEPTVPVIVVY